MSEDMEVVETPETDGFDKTVPDILILYLRLGLALWIQQVDDACPLPHSPATPSTPGVLKNTPLSSSWSLPAALGGHLRHK